MEKLKKLEDGNVYGSGYNSEGQLGLGNDSNVNVFTKLNLSSITQITTGCNHSIFINGNKKLK